MSLFSTEEVKVVGGCMQPFNVKFFFFLNFVQQKSWHYFGSL